MPAEKQQQNKYTNAHNRGCTGETLQTTHRYPTHLSQNLINHLCTPSTNKLPSQSRCSISANIITFIQADAAMNVVVDSTTDSLEYRHLMQTSSAPTWSTSFANNLGRLVNGVGTRIPTGTNTMGFIPKSQVSKHKIPTYSCLVCDIRLHKLRPTVHASQLEVTSLTTWVTKVQ